MPFLTGKISKGFDEGSLTGITLIDLQKAFNTIDHEVLLQKFKAIHPQGELCSGLDPKFQGEYFLLILKVSLKFWKKFLWGTTRVHLRSHFIFDVCERYPTNNQINFTFICR